MSEPPKPDWQHYHDAVASHLRMGMRVLDVGCGRGVSLPFPWHRWVEVELVGIDPDPGAASNPILTSFVPMTSFDHWEVQSASFDLVVARYVLEHVEGPGEFLREIGRILKPGGRAIFLTPHLKSPVMFVSHLMPVRLKRMLLARGGQRAPEDVFPTYYRLNTGSRIRYWARMSGSSLAVETLRIDEFMPMAYLDLLGLRLSWPWFRFMRCTGLRRIIGASILVVLRKE